MKLYKLLLACALGAVFPRINARAEDVPSPAVPIWAQVQVCQLQQFLTQTIGHMRNIYPHPSLHIFPAILLGAWGYPDFQGLSREDPVTVTFYRGTDGDCKLDWVARAKFIDSSPINSALEIQRLRAKKVGEWAVIGRSEEILSRAEIEQDALFPAIVQAPQLPSVQIRLTNAPVKLLIKEWESTVLQNIAQSQTLEGSLPAISVLNFALNLARQIENIDCQLGVSDENLEVQFSFRAEKGSDLAMLFDAPPGGGEMAKLEAFLPAGGEMRWFCRSNPNVTKLFAHHIFDALFVYNENHSIGDASDRDAYNFFDSVWNLCGGLSVARANFSDGGSPLLHRLWAASLTPDQLGIWVDFAYNKIVPVVIGEVAKMLWGGEIAIDTKAVPKAFAYKKNTISRATVKLNLVDGDTACHQYDESYYYCAFGDFVAVTNSEKSMRHLIDEMASGNLPRAVGNGLAQEHGTVFRLQSDPMPQAQRWAFPPLDVVLKCEGGTATLKMSINSKLFGKWLQRQMIAPVP
jgi:hypothetical protein